MNKKWGTWGTSGAPSGALAICIPDNRVTLYLWASYYYKDIYLYSGAPGAPDLHILAQPSMQKLKFNFELLSLSKFEFVSVIRKTGAPVPQTPETRINTGIDVGHHIVPHRVPRAPNTTF